MTDDKNRFAMMGSRTQHSEREIENQTPQIASSDRDSTRDVYLVSMSIHLFASHTIIS